MFSFYIRLLDEEEEIEIVREQIEDEDLDTKVLHLLVTMIGKSIDCISIFQI